MVLECKRSRFTAVCQGRFLIDDGAAGPLLAAAHCLRSLACQV